jgi:general stress protein 26
MALVEATDKQAFFEAVDAACRKAVWAAVATVDGDVPRVRMVHPTWEGDVLWFATGAGSPKARQLTSNPAIELQYQVGPPDFVHIIVSGTAEVLEDRASREHVWEVLDYDLAEFWPGGVDQPGMAAIRITPQRVELSEMFGSTNKRVWRA